MRAALTSPRQRASVVLEREADASHRRSLIHILPGSYVRPHQHPVGYDERLCVLSGEIGVLYFAPHGSLVGSSRVGRGEMVDIAGGVFHTAIALFSATVIEIKPNLASTVDRIWLSGSPVEGDAAAKALLATWSKQFAGRPG